MKILALDTSAGPASCALWEDGRIIAENYVHNALTHSQTLMPMVESMLRCAGVDLKELDLIAVCAGPGSFTGVRIGVSAVKGLAFAHNIPCAEVSTLAAIAQNGAGVGFDGILCAVMDARCGQMYTACFTDGENGLHRESPDEAIAIEELKNRLISYKKTVLLLGDGAQLCYTKLKDDLPALRLAPEHLRFQRAWGAAAQGAVLAAAGRTVDAGALRPVYLRLPQAERELKARQAATQF